MWLDTMVNVNDDRVMQKQVLDCISFFIGL